jgi:hypothetical protein
LQLPPVEEKERGHRRMPHSLVPIQKWMVLDEGESQGCCLGRQRGISLGATNAHPRLSDSRLESGKIPDCGGPACLRDDPAMEFDDFSEAQIPHLSEPTVELFVRGEDMSRGPLEILCWPREEVPDGGSGQVANRYIEPLGRLCELALGITGEIERDSHNLRVI